MFSVVDSLYQLFALLPFIVSFSIIVFGIVYGVRLLKRMEKRAEEKLQINKDSVHLQRKQMEIIDQLEGKLLSIEKILKNVE
ncbi:hypothetical protein [Fervidibacillus albus]|uniref:Uncharacterized protein n=1 Tax=Fervidibacillus albus TaxID=2980026 RepID=A0A9E8RX28_9BACI|nr:hypothetical protein [Fervidibacillus albus]WAA10859.1 hypothetical protein OE104_05970 [Fervidibacillus albus]